MLDKPLIDELLKTPSPNTFLTAAFEHGMSKDIQPWQMHVLTLIDGAITTRGSLCVPNVRTASVQNRHPFHGMRLRFEEHLRDRARTKNGAKSQC